MGDSSSPSTDARPELPDAQLRALTRLLDKDAIWSCLLRYSRGLDRLDLDLLRSAYWPDAITSHGPSNGSVDDFLAFWLPLQPQREVGQHSMSNFSVSFAGDQAADVETYFLASIKQRDSDLVELLAGRYVDRFEKRAGEWRILTRLLIFEWAARADATGMPERLAGNHQGSRDRRDPSYESPLRPRTDPPVR